MTAALDPWEEIGSAPRTSADPDYGPLLSLKVQGGAVDGRWSSGFEIGEIWIPPGWYSDDGEIEPTHWRGR